MTTETLPNRHTPRAAHYITNKAYENRIKVGTSIDRLAEGRHRHPEMPAEKSCLTDTRAFRETKSTTPTGTHHAPPSFRSERRWESAGEAQTTMGIKSCQTYDNIGFLSFSVSLCLASTKVRATRLRDVQTPRCHAK